MALQERCTRPDLPRRILTCVFALLLSTISHANSTDVYWSGFAYQGEQSAAEKRYPNSFKLSKQQDGDGLVLDNHLREKMRGLKNGSFNIKRNGSGFCIGH